MKLKFTLLSLALAISSLAFANSEQPQVSKPDANKGEEIYTKGIASQNIPACLSCHGANGNSASAIPKLAAQHSAYTYKQLQDFKHATTRKNPIMTPYAQGMSDQEMKDVAFYLSKQPIKIGNTKTTQGIELGQKIYRSGIASKAVPACAACHGANGAGIPAQYARIGGQSAEYTKTQLLAFKNEIRKNGPHMVEIAGRMSDKEIEAVSDYISGLK